MSFFGKRPSSGDGRIVLITGLPRSGTTLSCHLLNKVPDVVALHEPMDVSKFFGVTDPADVRRTVQTWCEKVRDSVLTRGVAPSKQEGGKVPDNPIGRTIGASGARQRVVTHGEVKIDRPMTKDFTLVVKHPGLFTHHLESLVGHFPLCAIVRNPLSVLSSWNSVDLPIRNGRITATEKLAPDLSKALDALPDATARQLHILDWYLSRFVCFVDPSKVVRYEEMIASRGKALAAAVPAASSLDEPLESRNKSDLYGKDKMRALAERLLADQGAWRKFYSPADVEALVR